MRRFGIEENMKKLWNFGWGMYKKYEEGINYLFFGFLAFVLNYILYFLFESVIRIPYGYIIATALAWALTVVFAYWTNRRFVFKSNNKDMAAVWKEFVSFISARVVTGVLEMVLMYLLVDCAHANDKISKLICQTIVILANYILSKIWIFKSKNDSAPKEGRE